LAIVTGILAVVSLTISWPEKINGKSIPALQLESSKTQNGLLEKLNIKLDSIQLQEQVIIKTK
jgi:hypothetical protein